MNKIITIIIIVSVAIGAFFILNSNKDVLNQKSIVNSDVIDLSNVNLSKIPEYVFKQTNIRELNVSGNNIKGSIQAEIRNLKELKVLNASNNLMTGVPAEIGQLTKLEVLDLSKNMITGLPNELGNLKNLKTLNLSGNLYSKQDLDYIRGKLSPSVNIIVSQ